MKMTVGEKIAMLRKERGVTQTQLAEHLFVAPQAVSRWEVGCGAPEISLLPGIAGFFGVSIDELFGLTSLERVDELVSRYSVLRDDGSFREAMDCISSQLLSVELAMKSGGEDQDELARVRDSLEAEKAHMWIQQGREAFARALSIVEGLAARTQGDPEHPWYMPARLQRDQLCHNTGSSRRVLLELRRDFEESPDNGSMLRYLSMLSNRQDYEAVLSAAGNDRAVSLLFPPAGENLPSWLEIIDAAAKLGETGFIERNLPDVLEACGPREEVDFLMCVLDIYEGERLEKVKSRVRSLLPGLSLNKFFEEKIAERLR